VEAVSLTSASWSQLYFETEKQTGSNYKNIIRSDVVPGEWVLWGFKLLYMIINNIQGSVLARVGHFYVFMLYSFPLVLTVVSG